MAEAVGWVGGTSRYGPFYTSRHLVEKGYLVTLGAKHHDHEIKQIEVKVNKNRGEGWVRLPAKAQKIKNVACHMRVDHKKSRPTRRDV
jgi:hypothetical protein